MSQASFMSQPTVTVAITIDGERVAIVSLTSGWTLRPTGEDTFVIERYDPASHGTTAVAIPVGQTFQAREEEEAEDMLPVAAGSLFSLLILCLFCEIVD